MFVVIAGLVIFTTSIAVATPRRFGTRQAASTISRTRLRNSAPGILVASQGAVRELRFLSVEVQNIGGADARGIQVLARCGFGLVYPLKGPSRLLPRERGVYTLRGRAVLPPRSHISVASTCANCSRD